MSSFASQLRRAMLIVVGGERLRGDPLFDADFYRWAYPDAPRSVRAAARHYAVVGGHERVPSVDFAAGRYAARELDVVGSGLNPLVHYIRFGRREGRQIRSHFARYFVDDDGRLDREALATFLRSGELVDGRGSVLRALPHLLHAMPRGTARRFGEILVALATGRVADLGPVIVSGPTRGRLEGVAVSIVGDAGAPGDILATASLAALMVGGEVGRENVTLPGEDARVGEVMVEVVAGALVIPGSLAYLVDHARLAPGVVEGVALDADGGRVVRWDGPDARAPTVLTARVVESTAASDEALETTLVGGATAVWWPGADVTPRKLQRPVALVMDVAVPTPDPDSPPSSAEHYSRTLVGLGYRVLFVPEDLRFDPRNTPELESWGVEVVDERDVDALERVLDAVPLALAVLIHSSVFEAAHRRLRRAQADVPVLFVPLRGPERASDRLAVADLTIVQDADDLRRIIATLRADSPDGPDPQR